MKASRQLRRRPAVDGHDQHSDWLSLVEVDGPFLTMPVLLRVWPTLDAVDSATMDRLRDVHVHLDDKPRAWVEFCIEDLLGWAGHTDWGAVDWAWTTPDDITVAPDFALMSEAGQAVLGFFVEDDADPRGRVGADDWAATRTDRAAAACRHFHLPFALVTNGRLWCLVWAPTGVTSVVTFDSATWTDAADRVVVRAFRSLLHRSRFVSVPSEDRLDALLRESAEAQEEITEQLGVQVRRAVEQLVEAMGRWDAREQAVGRPGLSGVPPHDVYGGAVTVLMRLIFMFFAEERGLLPSDNPVYADSYGASILCAQLETRAQDAGEEALEHGTAAWLELLAAAHVVYGGVDTPELRIRGYDGSLFDPSVHPWLTQIRIDDRTLMHVLQSVQYVVISKERRRVSFRSLQVEQIGYVYEGLLAFDAVRSRQWVLGLIGKPGVEEEVALTDLERLRGMHTDEFHGTCDLEAMAADLAERYKSSGIGSVRKLTALLAEPAGIERTRRLQRLLAVTDGDRALAERMLPFAALIRPDLRGLPTVVPAGSLYVTASGLRASSGTHYTPRELAEQVTATALLPLVYGEPGPLQTEDEQAWPHATAEQILALRVCDIAMGSGAFLVAACRFLGDHLVRAWAEAGDVDAAAHLERTGPADEALSIDGEVAPVVTRARRAVIEHCLYGVDVNPMAVEMAKLSLWLVSMDPGKAFTFLDAHVACGDSLLGIASLDQLEALHLLPERGRALHRKWRDDPTRIARTLVADFATARQRIEAMPGDTRADQDRRRDTLADARTFTWRANLMADLVTGSALTTAGKGLTAMDNGSQLAASYAAEADGKPEGSDPVRKARGIVRTWLDTDLPDGADPRHPLHWPLVFPEVFVDHGGFDAIIGNPPFLGGKKITAALGTAYRNALLHGIANSVRGNADLVAYFVLRAHDLLNDRGQTGLIATNTIAQGDTREVGLDQLVADGVTIKAAIKSEPWPAKSAVLQYAAIWTTKAPLAVRPVLDGVPVTRIAPTLDAASRVIGNPHRLAANAGISFIGSYVLGMGFTMEPERAQRLIESDPRNADVLFPYLNGQDLNSRPDCSASRWVINFRDWDKERAASYPVPFEQVKREVKPQRDQNKKRNYRERWWQFGERCPGLYRAIRSLNNVIAITLVSKVVMPVLVPTGQVFSHALGVVASEDFGFLGVLSSAPHYWWTIERCSTLETRIRYTPTDVFETFPRPASTDALRELGERLDTERRDLMLARQAGLTATYNLVHDSGCTDADIVSLRELHRDIDHAVFAAYGWDDLDPVHDHFETRQGIRWTIDPATRQEMLDRLLELNFARHADEQAQAGEDGDDQEGLF